MFSIGAIVFDQYELLDVYGPLEMFGMLPEHFSLQLVAENTGCVSSAQGPRAVVDTTLANSEPFDIILVPGGAGTRTQVDNAVLIEWLAARSQAAKYVCAVCTGSALLARSGVLDGRKATTNKRAFKWVSSQSTQVEWVAQARWVEDGKFFTSSGVSAGIDMSIALIARILGAETAKRVAGWAEYEWNPDSKRDRFAAHNGLV